MIVIDASVALAWYLLDERSAEAIELIATVEEDGAIAPSLWRLEVANVLQMAVRRRKITQEFQKQCLGTLKRLAIRTDRLTRQMAWSSTLLLARAHDLTVYDAAYLELALRVEAPLATLDKQLATAARAASVPVLPDSLP